MTSDHEEPMETGKSGEATSCSDIELGEEGPDMFDALYPIRSKWPVQTLDTATEEDKEDAWRGCNLDRHTGSRCMIQSLTRLCL